MKIHRAVRVLMCLAVLCPATGVAAAQSRAPKYDVDPFWPKPLPNRWVVGEVGGVCIDAQDHVFILNRQDTLKDEDLDAGIKAPAVIEFDPEGKVVNSWGELKMFGDLLHGCAIDNDNNIWIVGARSGIAQKYSHDGSRLLLQLGKTGVVDSDDGTTKGKPLNSSAAVFFQPAGIVVDRKNGDILIADGESANGNHRIAIMDRTGKFLRQFQLNRTAAEKDIAQVPHCLGVTNDGLVYVCDRRAHRIQVFDKMGNFKKNIDAPWKQYTPFDGKRRTGGWGSASSLDFSRDASQRYIFTTNEDNEMIDIFDRDTGSVSASFGRGAGHFPGQFIHAHGVAVDSKGNVYIAEVNEGKRIQKFKIVGQ